MCSFNNSYKNRTSYCGGGTALQHLIVTDATNGDFRTDASHTGRPYRIYDACRAYDVCRAYGVCHACHTYDACMACTTCSAYGAYRVSTRVRQPLCSDILHRYCVRKRCCARIG